MGGGWGHVLPLKFLQVRGGWLLQRPLPIHTTASSHGQCQMLQCGPQNAGLVSRGELAPAALLSLFAKQLHEEWHSEWIAFFGSQRPGNALRGGPFHPHPHPLTRHTHARSHKSIHHAPCASSASRRRPRCPGWMQQNSEARGRAWPPQTREPAPTPCPPTGTRRGCCPGPAHGRLQRRPVMHGARRPWRATPPRRNLRRCWRRRPEG